MKIVVLEAGALGGDVDFTPLRHMGETVLYDRTAWEEIPERVADAEIVIANKVPVNRQYFGGAAKLRLVCVTATGINNLDGEFLRSRGIHACNVAGYSTDAVAQHTFASLFYIWQKLRYYDDFVKSGEYAKGASFSHFGRTFRELAGKTWGIIGMGAIGRKVASIAEAFGCRVLCYSASGSRYDTPYEQVDFDTLLRESDVVSIHAPLNEHTENLMDLAAFRKNEAGRGPGQYGQRADRERRGSVSGAGREHDRRSGAGCSGTGTDTGGASAGKIPGQQPAADHAAHGLGRGGDQEESAAGDLRKYPGVSAGRRPEPGILNDKMRSQRLLAPFCRAKKYRGSLQQQAVPASLFLNDLNFQIIKINLFNEAVLAEPCPVMALEFTDVGIQPDGLFQIQCIADLFQALKNLVGAGIPVIDAADGIPEQMIVFPYFSP